MMQISLFGYGKTTKALAKEIKNVVFYDDECKKTYQDESGYTIKPSDEFNADNSYLEIPSPGIAPSNPLIKKAKNLISEYDYFAKTTPLKVWISGTNGKTTTTQMMEHILRSKGAVAGGNIGTPLATLDKDAKIWLLETSSFTMHYTNVAKPSIYVLLPITPDHISWHGTKEAYIEAKLKPLLSMEEGSIAIIPKEFLHVESKAHLIGYENEDDLSKYFDIDISKIKFRGAFLLDAILAMSVDKILFDDIAYDKINSFTIDAHRQEELRDRQNRLWVNDTKATNIDATICAIKNYQDRFIHLILGGDDKGVELDELFAFLKPLHAKVYAIGSNKQKLCTLAKKYNIKHTLCQNLKDAILQIDKNLKKDEVALLSPAAASLDEFRSYAHRGEEFKETVKNLKSS